MQSITAIPATICALFGIDPPPHATGPLEEVLSQAPGALAGSGLDRCLIYAPDAIGRHLEAAHANELARVHAVAPIRVELRSVVPPVTPVCFASMFSGAPPEVHGIQRYERPQLHCDTLFDSALRAGLRVAIVAVRDSSVDLIFRGREMEYYSEDYDAEVTARALTLLAKDRHEMIIVYHQEYDDTLHRTTPLSAECIAAFRRHVESFESLAAATSRCWAGHNRLLAFCPDHGAHIDPGTGKGTHGLDIPADMELAHYFAINPSGG